MFKPFVYVLASSIVIVSCSRKLAFAKDHTLAPNNVSQAVSARTDSITSNYSHNCVYQLLAKTYPQKNIEVLIIENEINFKVNDILFIIPGRSIVTKEKFFCSQKKQLNKNIYFVSLDTHSSIIFFLSKVKSENMQDTVKLRRFETKRMRVKGDYNNKAVLKFKRENQNYILQ
ncbi:MAG: hypothetical protein EOO43_15110 [Flavobacterium sp.]|nr:MAG: hypothetical protein EOO43_15110 [Flavobacterium sp.]